MIALRDRLDQPAGTNAEQVILDAAGVAPAATGTGSAAAATIPLNGLTALQALDALALVGGPGGSGVDLRPCAACE